MDEIPELDLSLVEYDPYSWRSIYPPWIINTRIIFNSLNHQLYFFDSDGVNKSFYVLPPVPQSNVLTFKNARIRTGNSSITLRINCHNLYVCGFLVSTPQGEHWYVFRDSEVGDIGPRTYMDTSDSYTELVPKTKQHRNAPTPTRESIPLGRDAMIGAVDSIASPWHVDDNGIAIISQSKAKSAVVLIQMISEAICFHTVLDTLAGLDVFCSTDPNLHPQIWVDQNRWSRIGKAIFEQLRTLHGNEEDIPTDKRLTVLEKLMKNHELVSMIMSEKDQSSGHASSSSSFSRKNKEAKEKGESCGLKEWKSKSSKQSKSPFSRNVGGKMSSRGRQSRLGSFFASLFCFR